MLGPVTSLVRPHFPIRNPFLVFSATTPTIANNSTTQQQLARTDNPFGCITTTNSTYKQTTAKTTRITRTGETARLFRQTVQDPATVTVTVIKHLRVKLVLAAAVVEGNATTSSQPPRPPPPRPRS
jgi:hypothetical protein